jgi:hypothetical protein
MGALFLRAKKSGHEANKLRPPSSEVKNIGTILPFPHTPSLYGASLIKHRDNFALPLLKNRCLIVYLYVNSVINVVTLFSTDIFNYFI